MGRLQGKSALVTGGSRGIGRTIAIRLAMEGANVAVCSRNASSAAETAAAIGAVGVPSLSSGVDVTEADQVQGFVKQTINEFGALDILVNNAGIARDKSRETSLASSICLFNNMSTSRCGPLR